MSDESLLLKAAIGGGVCAVVSATLNPFDVTKIRMQNQVASDIRYHGLIPGAMRIWREEGIAGWGKGVVPSMMREIVYSSVRMGAYEPIREAISNYLSSNTDSSSSSSSSSQATVSPAIKFSSALISGGVGSAIANPLDLIKTRFQAALPHEPMPYNNSTLYAFRSIVSQAGVSGLYKGWIVTSSRAAVLTSAQLGSYDSIKNNLLIGHLGLSEGFLLHLCSSMLAGIITTTAANPIDVIKTRYMADKIGAFKSPLHCVVCTFKEGGVMAFFNGWVPAYWRLGPHTVTSLILIEKIRLFFGLKGL